MPLPITTFSQLRDHLDVLGINRGDRICVHSRLIAFGRIEGGCATVLAALRDAVGAAGTLAFPTYTLERGEPYDPANSPAQGLGPLPDAVLAEPDRVRSSCPMHNHAAIGADADVLTQPPGNCSLGPESDFAFLHQAGFRLLLLGAALSEGATYVHHVEAVTEVPYREWREFARARRNGGGDVETVQCRYYARMDAVPTRENFDVLEQPLITAGAMTTAPAAFGASRLCALRDLHVFASEALAADPFALVTRL